MFRKIKRLAALITLPPLLLLLAAGVYQAKIYRNNQAVTIDRLPQAPSLQKTDRLLVIAPHLDDETLGAAGTVAMARQQGIPVRVVFITNGDGSGSTRLVAQARELRGSLTPDTPDAKNLFQRIAAMRRREAVAACKALGVNEKNVIFLGYPDGGTRFMWEENWDISRPYASPYTQTTHSPYANSFTERAPYAGAQVVQDLEKIITNFKPTLVMTTHPEDMHPDHATAYAYSFAAIEQIRLKSKEKTQTPRLLTFLVHHGFWPTPHGYHPDAILAPPASLVNSGTSWLSQPLTPKAEKAKKAALEEYSSQLVFTPNYLRAFVRRNELFGKVPVQRSSAAQSASLLLANPPADSAWREAWRPADIERLNYVYQDNKLTLGMELAATPSPMAQYRFILHGVSSQGIKTWTLNVSPVDNTLQATLTSTSGSPVLLKGTLTPQGMRIVIPGKNLGISNQPVTLLISASSHIGQIRVGQTATVALRLQQ